MPTTADDVLDSTATGTELPTGRIGVLGLAHVGVRVADARRSGDFYALFGFDWGRRDRHERVHVLRHPTGIELNLIERADPRQDNVLLDVCPRCPGYTHIALRVRDIHAVAQGLASSGVGITEGPVRFGDGSTAIFVRDPDGNVVELTEPAPAGTMAR